jgi:hypothetical protein
MDFPIDRRSALKAGAALAVACLVPARAQAQSILRFAAVFSDRDIRASMIQMFAKEVEGDFKVEPFYNAHSSSKAPSWSPCSATISKWVTSRRRTFPTSFRPGRS